MKLKKILKWPIIGFLSILTLIILKFEKKENSRKSNRGPSTTSEKTPPGLASPAKKVSPAAVEVGVESSENSLTKEISELAACYEKDCVPVSAVLSDPRTEYYSLGQRLKSKLAEYNSYVTKNALKSAEVNELALQFLAHSDGHIQEVALELLSTQDPSEQNLDAILEHIIMGFDAELIHQAFLELQRYTHLKDQEKIRLALGRGLLQGTPFVSVAIAEKINLILNEGNISYFEEMMNSIDPKSRVYESLKYSIQEFEQVAQAG